LNKLDEVAERTEKVLFYEEIKLVIINLEIEKFKKILFLTTNSDKELNLPIKEELEKLENLKIVSENKILILNKN